MPFATLALVLVPALSLTLITRILLAGDDASVINGHLLLPGPGSAAEWILMPIVVLGWLWALTAGVIAVIGAIRGVHVSAVAAARQAMRNLPTIGLVLVGSSLLAWGVLALTSGIGLLFFPLMVLSAIVLARQFLVIPVAAMGLNDHWSYSSERVGSTVGQILIGVLAPAFILDPVGRWIHSLLTAGWLPWAVPSTVLGFLAYLVDAATVLVIVALQATVLGHLFARMLEDTTATDELLNRLGEADGIDPKRWRALLAGFAIPALIATSIAIIDPYDRPRIHVSEIGFGPASATAWPQGQHPILVTHQGIVDCHDDACLRNDIRSTGLEGPGSHSIAPTGAVLSVAATDGYLTLSRCTRTGACETGSINGSGIDGGRALAIAEDRDGSILIAYAHDVGGQPQQVALGLIRCAGITCETRRTVGFGVIKESVIELEHSSPIVHLGFDSAGLPRAAFTLGNGWLIGTCESAQCEEPKLTDRGSAYGQLSLPIEHPTISSVRLHRYVVLIDCVERGCGEATLGDCCLDGEPTELGIGAGTRGLYFALSQPEPGVSGLHLSVGSRPSIRHQVVLWHCPSVTCDRVQRIPLHITDSRPERALISAEPDGRVLAVIEGRTNQLVTLTPDRQPHR